MTLARHFGSMPALQALLYLPAILALLILANIALRWSLADVYATQVSHHLDAGKKKCVQPKRKTVASGPSAPGTDSGVAPRLCAILRVGGSFLPEVGFLGVSQKSPYPGASLA